MLGVTALVQPPVGRSVQSLGLEAHQQPLQGLLPEPMHLGGLRRRPRQLRQYARHKYSHLQWRTCQLVKGPVAAGMVIVKKPSRRHQQPPPPPPLMQMRVLS